MKHTNIPVPSVEDTDVEDPTKEFMSIWKSLTSLDTTAPTSEVWELMREDIFIDGQERREKEGSTLLMFALWSSKLNIARGLVELGCDPSAMNARGLTVLQSLIRDSSVYKANRSPSYIASILREMPCRWEVVDHTVSKQLPLDYVASWAKGGLALYEETVSTQDAEAILSFIAEPLSYRELKDLNYKLSDCFAEGSLFYSVHWKAQLAKKASEALMDLVPAHHQPSSDGSSRTIPKF